MNCSKGVDELCKSDRQVGSLQLQVTYFILVLAVHSAAHDTHLTHGHRKLRLAEMLHQTPDFDTLRLTCVSKYCI